MNSACGSILVVDDDADFRELVATSLRRLGCAVLEAEGGEQALASVADAEPDVVLVDVELPGMNGYALCRELRELYGDGLPIVLVSGSRTESLDRVAGLLLGADDYLVKPLDPEELIARVRRLLIRAGVTTEPAPTEEATSMTRRELEVLGLLAEGRRPADIARELFISTKTVATHIHRILSKLGVHTQAQAVATAYRERLVRQPHAASSQAPSAEAAENTTSSVNKAPAQALVRGQDKSRYTTVGTRRT
jgi:DNA-binding NarL/FixJ family response regulator